MLAIIPARGGSKGVPNKNTKLLCGKPLIYYTIEAAKKSKAIDRIIVSTDSNSIANIAKHYNADIPFLRPKELATDNALAIDNYIYTIKEINKTENKNINEFVVLQPTSPLRKADDIDKAIELFIKKDADSVISFSEALHPPLWAKKIDSQNKISNYFNIDVGNKNRQVIEKAYMPNGAIFVFKYSQLKNNYTYLSDKSFAYIMPIERSVDIDTYLDFEFAEFLISKEL